MSATNSIAKLRRRLIDRPGPAALLAIGVIGLFAVLSWYATPAADDFTYAAAAKNRGLWPAIWGRYQNWHARWTATFIQSALPLVIDMVRHYWLIPGSLIAITCASCWAFVSAVVTRRLFALSCLLPAIFLVAWWFCRMPITSEGLYWFAGAYTYHLGNAGWLATGALILSAGRPSRGRLVAVALSMALTIGCNEVGMALLLPTLLIANAVAWRWRCANRSAWLTAFVTWCLLAPIMLTCPGNAVRRVYFPKAGDFGYSITAATQFAGDALVGWLADPALIGLLALALPAAALIRRRRMSIFPRSLPAVFAGIVIIACIPIAAAFPVFWGTGHEQLPPRVANIAFFVFFLALFALLAWAVPWERLRNHRRPIMLLGQLLFVAGLLIMGNLRPAADDLIVAEDYRQRWLARDAMLKDAATKDIPDVVVPMLNWPVLPSTIAYPDLSSHPHDWINKSVASFYGVESVRAWVPEDLQAQIIAQYGYLPPRLRNYPLGQPVPPLEQ